MSEFIKQYQAKISSKEARELGFEATKDRTGELLADFFKDIVDVVMEEGDDTYLVQWAICKMEKDDAAQAG